MESFVKFTVNPKSVDERLAKDMTEAQAALNALRIKLIEAYKNSPQGLGVLSIAQSPEYGEKLSTTWDQYGNLIVSVRIRHEENPVKTASYIDPKTTNLLLSGKLLSDDEKRHLIARLGFDLTTLTTKEGE